MDKIPDDVKNEIFEHMAGFKQIHFSTIEGDRPHVRAVTVCVLDNNIWVLTNPNSNKVAQIRANPHFEAGLPVEDDTNKGYLRLSGTASEISDREMKKAAADAAPYFDMLWKGVDDPEYALLQLNVTEVEYMRPGDFAGTRYVF